MLRRNSLAKVAAIEFTEDAIRQVLDSQVEDSFGRRYEGYVPTTLAELRAEKFGRDNVEAEIAFIARDLGRGENYKFC
jgi:citrate lyase gamma subunit